MRRIAWFVRVIGKILLGIGSVALLVTLRYLLRTPQPLASLLPGEAHIYKWSQGHIFYKVSGAVDAPPLVLLHAPRIGASSYEMRNLMYGLSQQYRVYALDLPGFGLSDRPGIVYSASIYVSFLQDFLKETVVRPATLLASGLSCNYSVMLATKLPELCERLIFLSPVNLFVKQKSNRVFVKLSQLPGCSFVLYALLTVRVVLRQVIARQQKVPVQQITAAELTYIFASAHQPGAQNAALASVSGRLALDVTEPFARLQQPLLTIWGEQGLPDRRLLAEHSAQELVVSIPEASMRIQEECPERVISTILAWRTFPVSASLNDVVSASNAELVSATVGLSIDTPELKDAATESVAFEVSALPVTEQEEPVSGETESEPVGVDANVLDLEPVMAYCVKCRMKQSMENARKIVTKNGRSAMEGTCAVCHTKLFRFVAG